MKPKEKSTSHENVLCQLSFDSAFQANLIFIVDSGKIVMANALACKLLGYTRRELLAADANEIFEVRENNLKRLHSSRLPVGQFKDVLTLLKKSGKRLTCKITSATFMSDRHIKKTVATLGHLSRSHAAILVAQSSSDAAVARLGDLEHKLDNEISSHQRLRSSSRQQKVLFKKELNEKVNFEIRLKKNQIAEAIIDARELERSDIGKELHDNVNQLLSATRLYLDMARKDKKNRDTYLDRSSEYTLTAIEEIRKLTKGLTADAIKNFGLFESVRNICKDTMEVNPIKISCRLDLLIENMVNNKFKLNIYRIMQEQLTNILKHAEATEVIFSLSQNKKFILLSITDNGVGFDTDKKQKGIGIDNIKSRALSYKGIADFDSQPGQGCVLHVKFPIGLNLLNRKP